MAADTPLDSALQISSPDVGVASDFAGMATVSFTVRNLSTRTINGFSYSVLGRYADGGERTARQNEDLYAPLMLDRLPAMAKTVESRASMQSLGPGQSKHVTALLPLSGEGQLPVSVTAKLLMIAFDDNTALGDPIEITQLQEARALWVEMISAIVADLQRMKRSPSPKEAAHNLILSLSGNASQDAIAAVRMRTLQGVSKALEGSREPAQTIEELLAPYEALLEFGMKRSNLTKEK